MMTRIAGLFRTVVLLVSLGFALSAAAVPDNAAFKALLDRATVANYPNADTVTVYDCDSVIYQRDGLYVDVMEFCSKALTEAGRKGLRQLALPYRADYSTLAVESAMLISPDGTRTELDVAKRSKVSISTGDMSSNIFNPERKVLSFSVPELEIGGAICLKLRYVGIRTPFPGKFSTNFLLQDDVPILHAEVTVDAPAALPLNSIAIKDKVGDTVKFLGEKRRGDRIVYSWIARDVPQVFTEPKMPRLSGVAQRLLVSTAKDWPEISRWYYELCLPHINAVDDAVREEVKKLVAGKKSDEEKAMALFQFVSQKIRYTGVMAEKQAPGFEPHDVKDTFRQRHGVCRDKAGLLVAMLNLAGLKAYPVLFAASRPPVDEEVPASRFNHAIVAWEKAPGVHQLMDPTDETTRVFLPEYLANMSYLIAKPEGDVLRRSPSPPPESNLLSIRTRAEYLPDGSLRGESVFDFTGFNDLLYRHWFSNNSPSVMRQIFARSLQRAIPGCEVDDFNFSPADVRDMSKPLKVTVGYRAPELLPRLSEAELLPLPELIREFGVVRNYLRHADLDIRQHPLLFSTTCMVKEEFDLKLPRSVVVDVLKKHTTGGSSEAGFVWERTLTGSKDGIKGTSSAALTRLEVTPRQYPDFKQAVRRWTIAGSAAPFFRRDFSGRSPEELRRDFPDADSLIESCDTTLEVNADGSFELITDTRRRILTYSGVKEHSELKLGYNPHWETLKIEAVVISPTGVRQELEAKHVIDMDAGWVAGAPRYPGAKTKVAVFPGVAIGSVIESTVTHSYRNKPFMSFAMPFARYSPVAGAKFTVVMPDKSRQRISALPPGVDYRSFWKNGKSHHVWNSAACRQIPDELDSAPAELFAPTVFVSNGNYRTYAEELDEVCRKLASAPSPAVDEIVSGLKLTGSEREKAIKIRDYAAKRLRRAGPALNQQPFSCLTPPERTFADGYGNSADCAIALAALLQRAGIEYKLVARSSYPFVREREDQLRNYPENCFSDLLVYLPSLKVYLNDTDQYDALGATVNSNMIGLELPAGKLIAIRSKYRFEDEEKTKIDISINSGGSADIRVTRQYYGALFGRENRRFSEMTPEERRQYGETLVNALSPAARPDGGVQADFRGYPGVVSFRCRIENFIESSDGRIQFELPGLAATARSLGTTDARRRTPLLRARAVNKSVKYAISYPDNWRVVRRRPPHELFGKRSGAYYQSNIVEKRGMLMIDTILSLPVELIRPEDYIELVRMQRDLNSLSFRRVVLEPESKEGNRP